MSRLGRQLIKALRQTGRGFRDSRDTWSLFKDKPLIERVKMVVYTADILDPVFSVYYSILSFFANCRRLIEYAPLIWKHRNWDHGFVLRFQQKLYEDLYEGCFIKGHHVVNKSEARKLKVVIELTKRLHSEDYGHWHSDYLDKKYGPNDYYFKRVAGTENKPGGPYSTMGSTREDKLSKRDNEYYNKDRKRLWKLEEYQQKQDFELLGKYITKYSKKWWD